MFYRKTIVYALALMMLASSLLVVASAEPQAAAPVLSNLPASSWNGYLTIYPDGTLSDLSAPISQVGNQYTLTGNINGTLTVQYQGAQILGNGYSIWNTVNLAPLTLSDANNIQVENLTAFSWLAPAISIVSSSYDVVSGNTIYGLSAGIFVYSPYNQVSGNTVHMNLTDPGFSGLSTGIVVRSSSTGITGNSIDMARPGYAISVNAGASTISGNILAVNGSSSTGIYVSGSGNSISGNQISGNGTDVMGIELLPGSQNTAVTSNNISIGGSRAMGISVQDGFNTVAGNTVSTTGSRTYAVETLASGTGDSNVTGNSLQVKGQNSIGVYDTSQGSLISGNLIVANGTYSRGVTSQNVATISDNVINVTGDYSYDVAAPNGIVTGNQMTVSGSEVYGIYAVSGESAQILGNTVSASGDIAYGIYVLGSFETVDGNVVTAGFNTGTAFYTSTLYDSVVSNNNFSYSSTGIQVSSYSTGNDVFSGNYLYFDQVVFRINPVSTNEFYHNDFVNYTSFQVQGNNGASVWDNGYPGGGNYWSGYTGIDIYSGISQNLTGSDGIGDVQFNVSGSNIDHFPLVQPWIRPSVSFVETGLPSGTTWAVNFSGELSYSSSDSMGFNVTDAAYSAYAYDVAQVPGYTVSPAQGSVSYSGESITVAVAFAAIPETSYNVVFTQSGLPDGTSWSVTLDETTLTSTSNEITFDPVNGTYSYTISMVPGYSAPEYAGTVTVSGNDVSVQAEFSVVTYAVSFLSNGLPSGITWFVNLSSGDSYSATGSTISLDLPNGTYTYTVDDVSDYNTTTASGQFTISGHSPNDIVIVFNKTNETVVPPPASPSGPGYMPYVIGIIIGAVIVGIIAAVMIATRKK